MSITFRRYTTHGFPGRYLTIYIGLFQWDAFDWSLSGWVGPRRYEQWFALRCGQCRRFTLGCHEHWFCGTCLVCRKKLDDELVEGE